MRIKFLKICLILIITMIVPTFMIRGVNVGAVNNNDTTYNSTYKTIEIKGKVEGANISNRIVTILLKHNNKIVNIGDTNIDINGNYNYKFRISEYKPDMVLSIKRGNGDITSTLTSAIVKTTELREVPYKIENQSNKTHIYADFSELLKYTSQFIPIILQCDENGELIRCTPYSSADLTDTYIFDKYIDTVAFKTKLLVWSSFDTMLPVGKMTDASNELQISFGSIADTQMNNGYIPLEGANNYSKYKNAVAELPSEFITIKPAYPTIKREIYVSKTGNDANDGSINSPYLTLNKAIEKYKLLTLKEKNEWTAIYIREGRYDILTPLSLTGEVFGENGSAKLFIGAYNNEKVVLGNGKYVDGNIFKQVTNTNTDGATFGRINKNALGKIYYCDYSDLGITKLNGFSYGNAGAVPVLTFNGENQVLSRYPNSGENYISNVLQSGFDGNGNMTTNAEFIPDDKRPFNWEDTGTIGIKGQLSVTWFVNHMQASFDKVKQSITVPANQTVTKVDKTCWPISTNLKNHPEDKAHFFYYNVFEEIDMPGEWCGDDKNQRIYFYPPTQDILADDTIGITGECGDYKFKFNRVKDIVINGISFEFVEKGIEATECNNLLVQNCNFKNIQAMGVAFKFCKLSGVIYSDFRDCTRGISIVGEKSQVSNLVASRNFVQNCHFNGISANCIGIGETCGNIISHNLAENHMSSFTTIFGGSENVIEFNESRAGVLQGNEGNNIYIDGQYVSRNNHIRYNYIHDNSPDDKNIILGGAFAVDDMGEAQFIYGNIFKNLYSAAQANGGDNNIFDNNTLINCSSCSISAEPSMYGCNENLFGVSLLNDLTTSRLTNKYYSWGLNSSVKWGQRNSFAVNRISYLEDMSRLWNSGDKTSNDIMFTRGVTGTYITNNTLSNSSEIKLNTKLGNEYVYKTTTNPENEVPKHLEQDYNVSYNNKVLNDVNLADISYFNKIGLQRKPIYFDDLNTINVIYPINETEKLSGNSLNVCWENLDKANSYKIIIAKDVNFTDILQEKYLIKNMYSTNLQTYPTKESTYYYKIEAYNSGISKYLPFAVSNTKSVTFQKYKQGEDVELLLNAKTNLAENWLGTVGDVFLRSESQSAYATQMNDNGQYVRFTGKANLDNAKYRFVLGKNPYTEIENKSNVFDPATNVITECEIRFPNKENFGVSADVPVILFSVPTLATNPQIGADSKFIYFRIKSENGKYVLYTGEYGRNTPLTKLYEYTENELFGRWIKIKIDVDMQRGISTLSFDDGLYTKTCDMNKSDWQESTYWNNENFVRFLDFALIANNVNDFILDIKNVSMKRQVKIP